MKNQHKRNKAAISAHYRQGGAMGGTRKAQRRKGRRSRKMDLDDMMSRYNYSDEEFDLEDE